MPQEDFYLQSSQQSSDNEFTQFESIIVDDDEFFTAMPTQLPMPTEAPCITRKQITKKVTFMKQLIQGPYVADQKLLRQENSDVIISKAESVKKPSCLRKRKYEDEVPAEAPTTTTKRAKKTSASTSASNINPLRAGTEYQECLAAAVLEEKTKEEQKKKQKEASWWCQRLGRRRDRGVKRRSKRDLKNLRAKKNANKKGRV